MKLLSNMKREISSIKKMFDFVYTIGKKECFFVALICAFTSFMYPLLLEFNYKIINTIETNFSGDFKAIIILNLFFSTPWFTVLRRQPSTWSPKHLPLSLAPKAFVLTPSSKPYFNS